MPTPAAADTGGSKGVQELPGQLIRDGPVPSEPCKAPEISSLEGFSGQGWLGIRLCMLGLVVGAVQEPLSFWRS